jgi:hypothetical protein
MSMAIIAGVTTVAGTAYNIYATNKAGKQQGQMPQGGFLPANFKIPEVSYHAPDVWAETEKAASYAASTGLKRAGTIAKKSNEQAAADLEAAMKSAFGGGGAAFTDQREATNRMIEDHLAGRLSDSTRADLGRNLLASGVSSIGEGAADDLFTGYLGLTQEGLQEQGANEYKSLFSMYRQALPLTTSAEQLQWTSLRPGEAVQAAIENAKAQLEADTANAGLYLQGTQMLYQNGYNNAGMAADQQRDRNAIRAQKSAAIAQGIGAIGGAAAGYYQSKPPSTGYTPNQSYSVGNNTYSNPSMGGGHTISQKPVTL